MVPWLLLALGVARVVLTVALARTPSGLVLGNDFVDLGVYRVGADALLHGDSVYDRSFTTVLLNGQVQDPLPFNYPVFAALTMVPLALVPFWTAATLMVLLGLASVAVAAWLLAAAVKRTAGTRLPWSRATTAVAIGGLLLALEPVTSTLEIGQVNLILMAAVLVDVFVAWRLSGLLTGLATGVKLTPGVFILSMVVTRRGREAVIAVVAFLGTVTVGFLLQPGPAARYWREFVLPGGTQGATSANNQSLVADVGRLPGVPSLAGVAVAVAVVGVTLWLAAVMWRFDRLLATVAVAVGGLLASPVGTRTGCGSVPQWSCLPRSAPARGWPAYGCWPRHAGSSQAPSSPWPSSARSSS